MSDEPIYHLTFVRHGESVGNAENRMQGLSDYPLSETGRAQARALAEQWKRQPVVFDQIIASPLSRAFETAQILADGQPVEAEPLWVERDMGERTGLTLDEIRTRSDESEFVNVYTSRGKGAESEWALYLRAGQALHKILQRPAGRYLIVAHGAILNLTLYAILGITPQPNFQGPRFTLHNTAVCQFRYYPLAHRWRVDGIGERSHWKDSDQ
jgi:broad specificity phosphatase PhoE